MTKVNFADAAKEAEESGLVKSGGDYFKIKEGDNRIRLLSECLPHTNMYKGERRFKWLCYVIDRRDEKIKPFFMPHAIYKSIAALQINQDYAFTEVPMPYDVTINAIGAGTKEVKYSLIPARKESALTPAEKTAYAATKDIRELQDALKAADKAASEEKPPVHSDADEGVPF